jgi:hypothetical protein
MSTINESVIRILELAENKTPITEIASSLRTALVYCESERLVQISGAQCVGWTRSKTTKKKAHELRPGDLIQFEPSDMQAFKVDFVREGNEFGANSAQFTVEGSGRRLTYPRNANVNVFDGPLPEPIYSPQVLRLLTKGVSALAEHRMNAELPKDRAAAKLAGGDESAHADAEKKAVPSQTLRTPAQLLEAFASAAAKFPACPRIVAFPNSAREDGLVTVPSSFVPRKADGQPVVGQLNIGGTSKTVFSVGATFYGIGGAWMASEAGNRNVGFVLYGAANDEAATTFRELGSEAGVVVHVRDLVGGIQTYDRPLVLWSLIVYETLQGSAWLSQIDGITNNPAVHFDPFAASVETLKRLLARNDDQDLAKTADGPTMEGFFYVSRTPYRFSTLQWRLLKALWKNGSVSIESIAKEVYEGEDQIEGRLRKLVFVTSSKLVKYKLRFEIISPMAGHYILQELPPVTTGVTEK